MPKKLINALTAVQVKKVKLFWAATRKLTPERARRLVYSDGNGLTLRVGPDGANSWFQRLRVAGKQHSITLGHYPAMSLGDARRASADNLTAVELGENPVAQRREGRRQKTTPVEPPTVPTFREVAGTVIELRPPHPAQPTPCETVD